MNINIESKKTLWKTITEWFRGNSRLIKTDEYTLYKRKPSTVTTPEPGDILTGFFADPKTKQKVFGNALYLGDNRTPNYKLLNTVKP